MASTGCGVPPRVRMKFGVRVILAASFDSACRTGGGRQSLADWC